MKQALLEGLKELLRVVLLAVLPLLVSSLEMGRVDVKVLGIAAAIAFLRAGDKLLHEWGKEESTKKIEHWATKGLTRF